MLAFLNAEALCIRRHRASPVALCILACAATSPPAQIGADEWRRTRAAALAVPRQVESSRPPICYACDGGRGATTNVRSCPCALHERLHLRRGTRHAMRRCCACRGRCELHAPSSSCCVCACTITVPVLDGPVCPECARSRQAVRPTERRLQSVAAVRPQGRQWKRKSPPWA